MTLIGKIATCEHCGEPLTAILGVTKNGIEIPFFGCPAPSLELKPSPDHTIYECSKDQMEQWREIWEQDGRQTHSATVHNVSVPLGCPFCGTVGSDCPYPEDCNRKAQEEHGEATGGEYPWP